MLYFRKTGLGIWRVSANGGEEEEVTALVEGESGHVLLDALPNGRGILFTRNLGRATDTEIAVLSLETGEIRVLFQGAMARYAHSGHIVYTSREGTLFAVPFDMDRLEVTGSRRTLLEGIQMLPGSSSYFALSETGSLVYLPSIRGVFITGGIPFWMDREGSLDLLDPALTGLFQAPAFSPDGSKVALEWQIPGEPQDIWIYDLEQRTLSRLTFGDGTNVQPFWNPDGTEVGFSSNRDGLVALYARPADLSGVTRLLVSDADNDLYEGSWTPDGQSLVYRRVPLGTATTNMDIWYSGPDPDSTPVVILGTPARETTPSLSTDGRWIAYASNESGQVEVYVRPFPGPGGQSRVSVNGGFNPKWAHSGTEIFYLGLDAVFNVATVRTDPEFAVTSRQRLNVNPGVWRPISRQWDITPNEQRLLVVVNVSAATRPIVVVQNFFEELRERVPN